MEWIQIVLWTVAILLGLMFLIWLKANRPFQQINNSLRARIQSGLRVVGVDELEAVRESLHRLEQQVHARLAHLKTADKLLHQHQKDYQERDSSLVHFEQSGSSNSPIDTPFNRPRSVVRNGLRFTLSDAIWLHLGVLSREDLEDDQIQAMIQGPFCQICFKRLVGRTHVHTTEVLAQCRHCGAFWSQKEFKNSPISLLDLKCQIYISLDREFRTHGSVQG
jgi:hypothetical protein